MDRSINRTSGAFFLLVVLYNLNLIMALNKMKQVEFVVLFLFLVLNCKSQDTILTKNTDFDLSIGTFNSFNAKGKLAVNPAISGYLGDYYFENRYNYEASNSASINVGKRILKNIRHAEIIPISGLVFGSFKGITVELQTSLDLSKWILLSDNQFTFEYTIPRKSIYFNWNVIRYKLCHFFQIGLTSVVQQQVNNQAIFDKGLTAVLFLNKWSVRFYSYNYQTAKHYYWLGIRYNIHLKLGK
jgi:hypothetical protein